MTLTKHDRRPVERSNAKVWIDRSWVAVALIPVFFVLAFALGYLLYDLLGYKPENADAPLWADLVGTIPVLALSLVPCAAAVRFGWRADRSGDRRGLIPLGLGASAGLALTVISVVDLVAR